MSSTGNPLKVILNPFQLEEAIAGTLVTKVAQPLPQTATATLFTVVGGAVMVLSMVGIVSTAIGGTVTNLSLGVTPSVGTANNTGIGGPTAITSLVAGTLVAAPSAVGVGGLSLAAPGVPASTVVVNNPYLGAVDVTLSGFTLTQVFVNGVLVGSTNATYTVPRHGTISITYTVVGTWTWNGSVALPTSAAGVLSVPKDVAFIVSAGAITWTTSASTTGQIRWYLNWCPLDGTVVKGPKVT